MSDRAEMDALLAELVRATDNKASDLISRLGDAIGHLEAEAARWRFIQDNCMGGLMSGDWQCWFTLDSTSYRGNTPEEAIDKAIKDSDQRQAVERDTKTEDGPMG